MKTQPYQAPKKNSIKKSALFTALVATVMVNSFSIEANAMEYSDPQTQLKQVTSEQRYIYTTFGEALDTTKCIPEAQVEEACETVCREGDFKYITPEILEAVAYQESRFVPDAENGTAITMFQIKPHFHEESMAIAGVTLEDIQTDVYAQVKFGAQVLESYAQIWADKGVAEENILKAAVTNYHLTQEGANERIATNNWDSYTQTVVERAEIIRENKEYHRSAMDIQELSDQMERMSI